MLILLIVLVLFVAVALLTGSGMLLWILPGGVPAGNVLAMLGLLAAAVIPLRVRPGGWRFQIVAWVVLLLVLPWFPLGWALSGNPALDFSDPQRSTWFWSYTASATSAVVIMLAATAWLTVSKLRELSEFDE